MISEYLHINTEFKPEGQDADLPGNFAVNVSKNTTGAYPGIGVSPIPCLFDSLGGSRPGWRVQEA